MAIRKQSVGQARGQLGFPGDFYALARDVEQSHRSNRDASDAKSFGIFSPAQTQSRHNARARDDDARRWIETLFWWKEHSRFGYFARA